MALTLLGYLTDQLCQTKKELQGTAQAGKATKILDILYDCRFLLRFDVTKMPPEIGISLALGRSQVLVRPHTRWYWPEIVWKRSTGRTDVLAAIEDERQGRERLSEMSPEGRLPNWIHMKWIRTLDAS